MEDGMIYINLEWFRTPLSHLEEFTLESRNFNKLSQNMYCQSLANGLMREKFFFSPPQGNEKHSSGFYVNGISSYGYARFERIE